MALDPVGRLPVAEVRQYAFGLNRVGVVILPKQPEVERLSFRQPGITCCGGLKVVSRIKVANILYMAILAIYSPTIKVANLLTLAI